ncbi:hypothetical protein CRG98_025303 [Punica granatum]|uniref:Uncharacterized protein n=1 Tax=Punica granatum TaxID=22663 RepID=A0A2I0JDJ6_PUNGR|nr:hypothetical protein CRG98_025303 [Punica granatum]
MPGLQVLQTARTTADSDSRPLGIRRRSTPELESLSTRHPAKQKPSSRGGGITSKSTVAQQQSQLSARRNRPSNNIGLQRISTLGQHPPHTPTAPSIHNDSHRAESLPFDLP